MSRMKPWQKSTFSGSGPDNDCVEVGDAGGRIRIRESDDACVTVSAAPPALAALLRRVKGLSSDVLAE